MMLGLSLSLPAVAATGRGVGRHLWNFEGGDTVFESFARTGAGTAFTVGGLIQQFATGVPRVTDKGLLLEPARSELIANNQCVGAVVGNPGTHPSGWLASTTGGAPQIAGTGTQNGVPYIDIRFTSAAAASSTWWEIFTASLPGAPQGGSLYGAMYAAIVSQPVPIDFQIGGQIEYNGATMGGSPVQYLSLTSSLQLFRMSPVAVTTAGTTMRFMARMHPNPSGTPRDFTLRFGWPSFSTSEIGSLIATSGSQAARGAESAALKVPVGCTTWEAVYGDARTTANGSGLTPGASFDLVAGRPWIGLGKELKSVRFAP